MSRSATTSDATPRARWALVGAAILVSGIALRAEFGGPFAKYGGVALWATLVYCLVMLVRPSMRVWSAVFVCVATSYAVEFLQMTSLPMDMYRVHPVFGLVFGTTFHAPDLIAYLFGAVLGALLHRGFGCLTWVGIALLFVAGFVASYRTLIVRLVTYPFGSEVTSVDWYEPTELISGEFVEPIPTAAAAELGMDAAALERAAEYADELNSSAFVVLRRGQIVCERYWRGCDRDVPTNSFSMAKSLLALLVGSAIARGEIASVDAEIGEQIHEWRDQPRGAIRVRHFLGMESGLVYDNARDNPFSAMVQLHLAADTLEVVLGQRPSRPPGTDFEYNNVASQLLGVALERAANQRYADLLSDRIWRPIGARDATVWLDRPAGIAKMYGCVFATARDWARVGELVRNRGRVAERQVIPAEWFKTIETPSRHRPSYGLHIWLGDGDAARGLPPYVYLDGKSKQRIFIVRDLELVVVRVGESTSGWSDDGFLGRVVAAVR